MALWNGPVGCRVLAGQDTAMTPTLSRVYLEF
jgi:hypothetical protein